MCLKEKKCELACRSAEKDNESQPEQMQTQRSMLDMWSNSFVILPTFDDSSWVSCPVLHAVSQEKYDITEKSLQETNLNAQ